MCSIASSILPSLFHKSEMCSDVFNRLDLHENGRVSFLLRENCQMLSFAFPTKVFLLICQCSAQSLLLLLFLMRANNFFRGRSAPNHVRRNQGRSKQKISLVSRTFPILVTYKLPFQFYSRRSRKLLNDAQSKLNFRQQKIKRKTFSFVKHFFMEKNRHEKRDRRNRFDSSTKTDSAQRKFSSRLLLEAWCACVGCHIVASRRVVGSRATI